MKEAVSAPATRPKRLGVAEAKSRLSELLRHVADGPTIIHSRGRDLAVVLAVEDYDRLTGGEGRTAGGARFLERIEALKQHHGGGVDEFLPTPLAFTPEGPFATEGKGARAKR